MKILVITTSYPVKRDGSEAAGSYVEDFVKTLSDQADVAVVYPVNQTVLDEQADSVLHFPFRVPHLPLSVLSPVNPFNWPKIISTHRAGQNAVNNAVLDFKPDHIIAFWALPSGYWAKRIHDLNGVPYSIWALGSDIWSLGRVPIIKSILKNVLQNAHFCFADGYQLRDDVARISDREVHFMPSTRILPLSKTKVLKSAAPFNLAFLGRWHSNKGIDLLLVAMELLSDSDWEKVQCFRIAGGGPLESHVKTKVKALQDMHRPVELSGFLDTNAAGEFLLTADYLVIPSRIESIPVVFSDALQASTPMVATPVGDFPELFKDSAPGVMAQEVSAQSIANSIKAILATTPDDYIQNMRSSLLQFSVNNSVEILIENITEKL